VKKATKLMEILTNNHTKVLPAKYAKIILQVATVEERIKNLMGYGLVDKSKKLSESLIILLEAARKEYDDDQKK
jgi:hypothetical protein